MNDPKAPSDWFKVDGVDALVELALNLHWSWNHAADELWEALDNDLWATTQNPWVILRTVSREKIKAALEAPEFRQKLDSLLQMNREPCPDSPGVVTYSAHVSTTRPASDYTARIFPHHPDASVPLEAEQLLWQY